MAECWEAFSINRNVKELNETSFKSYREQLIKNCDDSVLRKVTDAGAVVSRPSLANSKRKADALPTVTPPAKRLHQRNNDNDNKTTNNGQLPASFSSDRNRRISLSPGRPVPSSSSLTPSNHSYAQRQGSGDIIFSYQPESSTGFVTASSTDRTSPKCQIQYKHFATNVQAPYRRFFTSIDDRAKALEKHLVDLGVEICSRFGLGQDNTDAADNNEDASAIAGLEAVGIPRQVKVTNIGRICNAVREKDRWCAAKTNDANSRLTVLLQILSFSYRHTRANSMTRPYFWKDRAIHLVGPESNWIFP
jgi:hypothetical protein